MAVDARPKLILLSSSLSAFWDVVSLLTAAEPVERYPLPERLFFACLGHPEQRNQMLARN
jgi:hypothetical protein